MTDLQAPGGGAATEAPAAPEELDAGRTGPAGDPVEGASEDDAASGEAGPGPADHLTEAGDPVEG